MENAFIKLGTGSMGGKARGIAFMNTMIAKAFLSEKYEDIKVKVPRSFVVCSDGLKNSLPITGCMSLSPKLLTRRRLPHFSTGELPPVIQENLRVLTQCIKTPLAVRSSSILKIPACCRSLESTKPISCPINPRRSGACLRQLADAVKLVYASVFYEPPVKYAKNADIRIEEEKMAVLIQELVGDRFGDLY